MRRSVSSKPDATAAAPEVFLRSVSVCQDAEFPDRVEHYRPTAKSVALLRSLAALTDNERAFLITAPYGSGKSLSAAFLLHAVENRPSSRKLIRTVATRMEAVSPDLTTWLSQRMGARRPTRGLAVALEGYAPRLGAALRDAALEAFGRLKLKRQAKSLSGVDADSPEGTLKCLEAIEAVAVRNDLDRVVIIWDEFGRHLETLVAEGRTAALNEVQQVAEWSVRRRRIPVCLGVLLHQGLLRYTARAPESVRAEWAKIEGRFKAIQYVDDSPEIYRLIGEIMTMRRNGSRTAPTDIDEDAKQAKRLGLFNEMSMTELKGLLTATRPLEPVTLHLLPRLAARVAQNERTLFDFLARCPNDQPVSPRALYDYFSPAMQADSAVGGTYRQWLETQSALSKVAGTSEEEAALKTACLLSLGVTGERFRASRTLLEYALRGSSGGENAGRVIGALIERNLLFHRKHSDEVAVWHGTDMDLRGKLEEAKGNRAAEFDVIGYLQKEFPAPSWRPVEYNSEYSIRRYFRGVYQARPVALMSEPVSAAKAESDGEIIYWVVQTEAERQVAVETALSEASAPSSTATRLHVVPKKPLDIRDLVLEVACLCEMQHDAKITTEDPLAVPELRQMADDARSRLAKAMEQLIWPEGGSTDWYHRGVVMNCRRAADVRRALSQITREVFSHTPRIRNEMIVRRKPSAVVINSRKKLVMAILERSGQVNLGIEGNFPDASMFRTVLLNPGVYRKDSKGKWGYAQPDELQDPGYKKAWGIVRGFLTEPQDRPKPFRDLLCELRDPPYGMRDGLLPILIAAGFVAFPSLRALIRDGNYVEDLTPSEVEGLLREPDRYQLRVLELDKRRIAYLNGLIRVFGDKARRTLAPSDRIRYAFDCLSMWRDRLPSAALSTRKLSREASDLQRLVRDAIDPVRLLLEELPATYGHKPGPELVGIVGSAAGELEGFVETYQREAATHLENALGLVRQDETSLRAVCSRWAAHFDLDSLRDRLDTNARGFLKRLKQSYDSDAYLLGSLSDVLIQKTIERWDDNSIAEFRSGVRKAVDAIEAAVLETGDDSERYSGIVKERIRLLYDRLVHIAGQDEAARTIRQMMQGTGGK